MRSTIESFVNKTALNDQQKNEVFTALGKPKVNGQELKQDQIKKIEDLVNNAPNLSPQQKQELLKQINDNLKEAPGSDVAKGVAQSFAENPPTKALASPSPSGTPAGAAALAKAGDPAKAGGVDGKGDKADKADPKSEVQKAVSKALEDFKQQLAKNSKAENPNLAENAALRDALNNLKNNKNDQGKNNQNDSGNQNQNQSPPTASNNTPKEDSSTPEKKTDHGNKNEAKKAEPLNFGDSKSENKNDNNQNAKNDKKEEDVVDLSKFAKKEGDNKKGEEKEDPLAALKKEFEETKEDNVPPQEVGDLGGNPPPGSIGSKLADLGSTSTPASLSQSGLGSGGADIGSTFGFGGGGDGGGGGGGFGGAPVIGGGGGGGGSGSLGEFPGGSGFGNEYGGGPPPSPKFASSTSIYTTTSGSSGGDGGGDAYMGDGNFDDYGTTAKKKASSVADEVYLALRPPTKEVRPGPFAYVERAYAYLDARVQRRTILKSTVRAASSGGLAAIRPEPLSRASR